MLRDEFAGNICEYKKYGNRARFWCWTAHGTRAPLFLRRIRPHLVIKADQADLAMEFASLPNAAGRTGFARSDLRLQGQLIAAREALRCRLVAMHERSGAARFRTLSERGLLVSGAAQVSGVISYVQQ